VRKILIAALLLSLLVVGTVYAQGITYNTGFMVQNLGMGPANLTITFYDQAGNVIAVLSGPDHIIPAGGSKNYYPLPAQVPNGFNGSVVIASDQPVAAIANELGNGLDFGASYAGFSAGATEVNLPLIMRNNGGFNTWFNVQNAGTADANVTVTYTPAQAGNSGVTQTAVIKPGAAYTFDQATLTALGSRFVGSAKVTSNQPIVATCNQVGPTTLLAYDGFAGGSPTVSFPLVNANNAGYLTGIQIMNIGTVDTNVTVSYTPSKAGTASTETKLIPAKGSAQFAFRHFTDRFVGSGIVTVNSANQPLVAVVNQLNSGANKGASYGGFDPDGATDKVSFPLVMSKNSGYYTSTTVQNVGTGTTSVTISYTDSSLTETKSLAPGESWVFDQNATFASRYVGSAMVTSTGGMIIGMCNELNPTLSGDAFLVYEGFSY
jgi:hypothetical protein